MALSGSKWLNLPNKVNLFPADRSKKKKSNNNETMNVSWCNSTYALGSTEFIHSFYYSLNCSIAYYSYAKRINATKCYLFIFSLMKKKTK